MTRLRDRLGQLTGRRVALGMACGLAASAAMGCPRTAWADGEAASAGASAEGSFANFDRSMLAGAGHGTADLSRFEHGNPVLPGIYNLDIYLNKHWVGRMDVRFAAPAANTNAVPCVDSRLLDRMGVAPAKTATAAAAAAKLASSACIGLGDLIPGATLTVDMSSLRVNASIPQAFMNQRPRGWVNPASWDAGVTSFLLNYNINSYRTTTSGRYLDSAYLGLRAGFNLGLWQFRQDSTASQESGTNQTSRRHWHNIDAYVQRALPGIRAVLSLGDSYTDGAVFDSYGLRGAQLATDDRMLPQSLRGYAPVVHGIAYTNAKVTVTQNGVQIYQTTVAPGPFVINDLYPTGYGGDLAVNVTEADGRKHSFTVPYASLAQLMRPGVTRFDIAVGQLRDSFPQSRPDVIQASLQHGFSNRISGYAGVQGSAGYGAALVGAALNTPYGALALDITQAHASIPRYGSYNGQSYRVSYNRVLPESGTSLTVAADRYSTSGFLSLSDAETARDFARQGMNALQYQPASVLTIDGLPVQSLLTPAQLAALTGTVYNSGGLYTARGLLQQRNRFTLTLNQRLGSDGGSLYANASVSDYWNHPGNDTQFQVGYDNHLGRLAYSISASRGRIALGGYDNQVSLNASLPLGDTAHAPSISFNLGHDSNSGNQAESTLNGALGEWNQFNYGATASHTGNGTGNAYDVNVGYNSRYAVFDASAGGGRGYSQASVGASGAVVAHPGGITFGQPTGDTVAIVHMPGATGAHILNAPGLSVDRHGYALVPYLTPYQRDTIEVDPQGLPLGVQLAATSADVAPYAGATVMVNFKSTSGRAVIVRIRLADGQPPPFGAQVFDAKYRPLGVVGQGGLSLLRGVGANGKLSVQWDDDRGAAHTCGFTYALPAIGRSSAAYQQMQATCAHESAASPSQKENRT